MAEQDMSDLTARIRQRREENLAAQAKLRADIENGTAPRSFYEARDAAAVAVGDAMTDDAREYIDTLVSDARRKAEREGHEFDPTAEGERIGQKIAGVLEFQRNGGVAGALRGLRPAAFDTARMSLEAARPRREPRESASGVIESPFSKWQRENANRADRQIDALQSLVDLAQSQGTQARWNLIFSGIAAAAGVLALIVAIIAIIVSG